MEPKRLWWQQIKQYRVTILVITIILIIVIALIIVGYRFDWTGFNGNTKSGKTLWDWLNLLGVLAIPVVVGFGAVWFTTRQGKVADAENKDNQRENALQTYIDKISELLLKEHLDELSPDGELKPEYEKIRKIARVRTLTVLPRLDSKRKGSVLQFLYESGLIDEDKYNIDLSGGNSEKRPGADLSGADLSEAILWGANFRDANLSGAKLKGFTGNTVEELEKQAKSLKGATMPDGSIHP